MTTLDEITKLMPPEMVAVQGCTDYNEKRRNALEAITFWHRHTAVKLARLRADDHVARGEVGREFISKESAFKNVCRTLTKERAELLCEPSTKTKTLVLEIRTLTLDTKLPGATAFNALLSAFQKRRFAELGELECKNGAALLAWIENDSDGNKRRWNKATAELSAAAKPFIAERGKLVSRRMTILKQNKKGAKRTIQK